MLMGHNASKAIAGDSTLICCLLGWERYPKFAVDMDDAFAQGLFVLSFERVTGPRSRHMFIYSVL